MYKIKTTHQFEKDLKRCIKRGYPMDKFRKVIHSCISKRFLILRY